MSRPLHFELPAWDSQDLAHWDVLTARSAHLERRAGAGPSFEAQVDLARHLIDTRAWNRMRSRFASRLFSRAVIAVWYRDPERARVSMTPEVVKDLAAAQRPSPSPLFLTELAQVFLHYFDHLETWWPQLFTTVTGALHYGVQRAPTPRGRATIGLLQQIRNHPEHLLGRDSPHHVAQQVVALGASLSDWFRDTGLGGYSTGRFGLRVRQAVYLEQIRTADPADPSTFGFLEEALADDVLHAAGTDGLSFGHLLLRALAERPTTRPCDEWMQVIDRIGGDPRFRHTRQWRTWWEPLGEGVQRQVIRWLSLTELELFLDAVEHYGVESGNVQMQRMFPDRSRFLKGLHHNHLIRETHLALGRHAEAAVSRRLGRSGPAFSELTTHHDTAVIIVDCGQFYLVEGSHNFKLGIYADAIPPRLLDHSRGSFTRHDIYERVWQEHDRFHPLRDEARTLLVHKGAWQNRAIRFLVERLGINFDYRLLIDAQTYALLRHDDTGLPVLHSRPLPR